MTENRRAVVEVVLSLLSLACFVLLLSAVAYGAEWYSNEKGNWCATEIDASRDVVLGSAMLFVPPAALSWLALARMRLATRTAMLSVVGAIAVWIPAAIYVTR
jgi:hypothetical protein